MSFDYFWLLIFVEDIIKCFVKLLFFFFTVVFGDEVAGLIVKIIRNKVKSKSKEWTKDTENNHKGHTTLPLEDYKKSIKNMKSNMRFKNYDQILKFIDKKQREKF